MYERILAYIAIAIIEHLENRAYRRNVAVDATSADSDLHAAGDRISRWMLENRPGSGKQPDQGGTGMQDKDLHPAG